MSTTVDDQHDQMMLNLLTHKAKEALVLVCIRQPLLAHHDVPACVAWPGAAIRGQQHVEAGHIIEALQAAMGALACSRGHTERMARRRHETS